MATTIRQSFQDFASNLEITDRQTNLVSTRRDKVVAALSAEISLHPSSPSKIIGAYDRNTLIRYLSEGDVDIMVVLHYGNNKIWEDSEGTVKVLDKFKSILDKNFPATEKRRDRNCISMKFSEFKLDVVPAFYWEGDYYKIPDSIRKQWIPTNPFKFANLIAAVNKSMGGSFVPLIKMVKGWNRDGRFLLRSFHIECMMYNYFRYFSLNSDYPFMLKEFFNSLAGHLATSTFDPIMGDRVDTYLDNYAAKTDRQIAIERARDAASKSKEAYEDQSKYANAISIAINEWKVLMGEFFPSYG